ncbi:MAG: fimbrillin family protein [Prevotella sp.]|nr:fimbrillin family protein [Prevotella sp.]
MKRYLILMTAATALLAACSNDADNEGYEPSNMAIAFEANEEGSATRAPGMIVDTEGLKALRQGFGVFGSYTGRLTYENTTVSPDVMYNQQITWANNAWAYSPVKYWPNDNRDYVSFFAYAPYEASPRDDGQRCIIDMSKRYDLGDPWINYRLAENPWSTTNPQVDLLYGQHEMSNNYTSWLDQQKPNDPTNYKVLFTFRHALACIGDEITIKCSPELANLITGYATITISQVTINYKNLTTKARLVLNSIGSANWKEIISGELTSTRTYIKDLVNNPITFDSNNFTTEQTISTGDGLLYIPLRIAGTDAAQAEVTITYTVTNNAGKSYTGTGTTTFDLDMNLEGRKQGIALQLTKNLDLQHLVYTIGRGAIGPSYSRKR